jgi:hypothetical protein
MEDQAEIPAHDDSDDVGRWVWQNLVPRSGQSDWVQGELLRCVEKLCWEAQTNGNVNWDKGFELIVDYLEETLCGEASFTEEARRSIREDVALLRNYENPYTEQDLFDRLTGHVVAFCRQHPSLIPKPRNPDLYR